ncbi:hypothetical protein DB30_03098 [Enhygromyxa salina]|uniref:MrfA-like Zn-binding domain-containing protein n=1 Tax=Enhygromyxa salina TaxID=215803 RepID=A0A0C2DD43_9BACT|nr:DUF1998 domain-containing protein [Enhygromyxa salina]KIG17617.1 hypothetical protein DB30_03098 [Enhygromyxa salina]
MARSKKNKKSYRPEGEIRRSQLLMGYGPGAMIDLLNDAVLIGGLDYWRYEAPPKHGVEEIKEPRLTAKLVEVMRGLGMNPAVNLELRPPPECNYDEATPRQGIQALEFPRFFKCQRCNSIAHATEFEEGSRGRTHQCGPGYPKKPAPAVPVRFVAVCEDGHINDWPWDVWCHRAGGKPRCDAPDIKLREGASGDISEIRVVCENCGANPKLAQALIEVLRPKCSGARPWLGDHDVAAQPCENKARLLVRTATNGYFAQSLSALWLPLHDDAIAEAVAANWATLGTVTTVAVLQVLREHTPQLRATLLEAWGDEAVLAAIERRREGADKALPPLDEAEYDAFVTAPVEQPAVQPPLGCRFFARTMRPSAEGLPHGIGRVVLVPKLREVRAQFGFSRLEAAIPRADGSFGDDAKIAPLALEPKWLPAIEINGEGLFLQFDEDSLTAWEARESVRARNDHLLTGFRRWAAQRHGAVEFRGARYYMLHTLSHLLMTAIALECGYAASSIRERIYCKEPSRGNPGKAGILLSTGTPGSEGTLGGLVEQGRYLRHHLRRAFDLGTLCSGDPVCALHQPELEFDDRSTEGAACHSCVYIPETSCESFNRFLDRGLVFPTIGQAEQLAFFGEPP